jgi:hypothetical protein
MSAPVWARRRDGRLYMPYGQPPTMREVWARLLWDVTHLFSKAHNPYVAAGEGDMLPKNRTALEDITHAIENVWKEWRRRRRE